MPRDVPSGSFNDIDSPVSLADAKELWDAWEIHCLILVSLFLQVFLLLMAPIRRRSTSFFLRTSLWLAYLSADTVAIFVLGHLAVHASKPRHQLMSFWAPFVLIHLGGQDSITAFSRQDNELWRRHLLTLLTQVAVAGYVVGTASWPDSRLKAAMVLLFISGCFKYAERTLCLYFSSPAFLRFWVKAELPHQLGVLSRFMKNYAEQPGAPSRDDRKDKAKAHMDILAEDSMQEFDFTRCDILSLDAPPNDMERILPANDLSDLLREFKSKEGRYRAYDYVGIKLASYYVRLYTKGALRIFLYVAYREYIPDSVKNKSVLGAASIFLLFSPLLLYTLLLFFSTPVALVLFMVAEKGGQHHTSQVDITVSYILLVGAMLLDVSSATLFLFPKVNFNLPSKRQWSEELAQYNMIKRYTLLDHGGSGIPITRPIKDFILNRLLFHGIRGQWHVASSRGLLAVQNWKNGHQDPILRSTREALEKIISDGVDFPTSMLILHIATDICYYFGDDATTSSNQMNEKKEVSRQLSNYIMYLVFKCGVKLTTNSQLVHDKAYNEIVSKLSGRLRPDERKAVNIIYRPKRTEDEQNHSTAKIEKQEPVNEGKNHVQKLLQGAQDYDSPVLPRACEIAQRLISINDEADRWRLIAAVWSEMLFYIAPRCGCAFHYEHLSTGGEFATHVLALMYELGPFLPPPDA